MQLAGAETRIQRKPLTPGILFHIGVTFIENN